MKNIKTPPSINIQQNKHLQSIKFALFAEELKFLKIDIATITDKKELAEYTYRIWFREHQLKQKRENPHLIYNKEYEKIIHLWLEYYYSIVADGKKSELDCIDAQFYIIYYEKCIKDKSLFAIFPYNHKEYNELLRDKLNYYERVLKSMPEGLEKVDLEIDEFLTKQEIKVRREKQGIRLSDIQAEQKILNKVKDLKKYISLLIKKKYFIEQKINTLPNSLKRIEKEIKLFELVVKIEAESQWIYHYKQRKFILP
ncbi:MAG: hypothetical protein ABIG64_09520 [Candidatus Omnitrophota bacterium]